MGTKAGSDLWNSVLSKGATRSSLKDDDFENEDNITEEKRTS